MGDIERLHRFREHFELRMFQREPCLLSLRRGDGWIPRQS